MDNAQADECIRQVRQGDLGAFARLVEAYRERVYYVAYRVLNNAEDARDICQDTFLAAHKALGRFELGRSFGAWVCRIATNLSLKLARKRYRRNVSLEDAPDPVSRWRAPDEDRPSAEMLADAVSDALGVLRPEHRLAFSSYYEREMSYQDIADMLDIPINTVKTHIYRARSEIRTHLQQRGMLPEE
jgi:RNA polymerase sigma-70 factor (ECF subfamily)